MGRGKVMREDDKRIGNKFSPGRPVVIKSIRHFKQFINSYFDNITKDIVETDENGKVTSKYSIYLKTPTLVSLALSIGLTSNGFRDAIFKYKKNDEDYEEYKKLYGLAKARCEAFLVEQIGDKRTYTRGQEFLLKNNYGYEDKITTDNKTEVTQEVFDISKLNDTQLDAYQALLQIGTSTGEVDNDE